MSFQVELVGFRGARVVLMGEQQARDLCRALEALAPHCPVPVIPMLTAVEHRVTHSRPWQAYKTLVNHLP